MKTFSIAEAQAHLPDVLEQAKSGEDMGIISGSQIIQLKPTSVVAWEDSYLSQEYALTPKDWEKFKRKMASRRAKRKYARFDGKFDPKQLA